MIVLPDFFLARERQHTAQTSSKMMQIKRKLDSGMIMINNSAEEIPLWFVSAGMSSIDDTFDTM